MATRPLYQEDEVLRIREFTVYHRILKGSIFSFADRPYLEEIYEDLHPRVVIKKARQVEITEYLLNWLLFQVLTNENVVALYTAPRAEQVSRFYWERFRKAIRDSRGNLESTIGDKDSATHLNFRNGSVLYLYSCWANAAAIEGVDADYAALDEYHRAQRGARETVESTLDHSRIRQPGLGVRGRLITVGVPTHPGDLLDELWMQTDRKEWRGDAWIPTAPENKDFSGYHISQEMAPWIGPEEIEYKRRNWPPQRFHNQVLGEPFAGLEMPLTIDHLLRCVDRDRAFSDALGPGREGYLGVDWGAQPTYCILRKVRDTYRIERMGEIKEEMIEKQVEYVKALFRRFNITQAVLDFGYGAHQNQQLHKAWPDKVRACYWGVSLKQPFSYDAGRYLITADRTYYFEEVLQLIRKDPPTFRFPYAVPTQVEWAFDQMVNLGVEFVESSGGRSGYKKFTRTGPDHAWHALVYAYLAAKEEPRKFQFVTMKGASYGRPRWPE